MAGRVDIRCNKSGEILGIVSKALKDASFISNNTSTLHVLSTNATAENTPHLYKFGKNIFGKPTYDLDIHINKSRVNTNLPKDKSLSSEKMSNITSDNVDIESQANISQSSSVVSLFATILPINTSVNRLPINTSVNRLSIIDAIRPTKGEEYTNSFTNQERTISSANAKLTHSNKLIKPTKNVSNSFCPLSANKTIFLKNNAESVCNINLLGSTSIYHKSFSRREEFYNLRHIQI